MPFLYIFDVTLVKDSRQKGCSEALNPSTSLRNIVVGARDFSSFVTFLFHGYINQSRPVGPNRWL